MNLFVILVSALVVVNAVPAFQRHERDVSHLNVSYLPPNSPQLKEYLPPVASKQPPTTLSNEYLPPVTTARDIPVINHANTIPAISGTQQKDKTLSSPHEYLPPSAEIKVVTEKLGLPTNEYLPPVQTGEDISEIPLQPFPKKNDDNEIITKAPLEESSGEVVETSIVPQGAGYHYEKPAIIPDLFTPQAAKAVYLPPL